MSEETGEELTKLGIYWRIVQCPERNFGIKGMGNQKHIASYKGYGSTDKKLKNTLRGWQWKKFITHLIKTEFRTL